MPVLESAESIGRPQMFVEVDEALGVVIQPVDANEPTPIFDTVLAESGISWRPTVRPEPTPQKPADNPFTGYARDLGTMQKLLDALYKWDPNAAPEPPAHPQAPTTRLTMDSPSPRLKWPETDPDGHRRPTPATSASEAPTLTDLPIVRPGRPPREEDHALSAEQEAAFQRFWHHHPEGTRRYDLLDDISRVGRWRRLGSLVQAMVGLVFG